MDQTTIVETQSDRDPKTGQFTRNNTASRKHGVFSARIPKFHGVRKLKRELEKLRGELEANVLELTPGKMLLIDQVIRSETQLRLIEYYLSRYGVLRPDSFRKNVLQLHPCLSDSFLSFLNAQKSALVSLGISKEEATNTLDVRAYALETYGKKKGAKGKTK